MTTTVRDLIGNFGPTPLDFDTEPTPSRKPWIENFLEFPRQQVSIWPPQTQAIENFLGSGSSTADFVGLDTPAFPLNDFPQLVSSEGDVTRDFDEEIIPLVAVAFSGRSESGSPSLYLRSLVGTESSSQSRIVDFQATMGHRERSLAEEPAMIGEMKRPRAIRRSEWVFEENPSIVTRRLQKELRGYAYEYRCPQVFLFDSKTLVVVQFRASNVEQIKLESCRIDCCVIPREYQAIPDQCTISYAIYRLGIAGWIRLSSTLESDSDRRGRLIRAEISITVGKLRRIYEYWSGRPYFVDESGHPVDKKYVRKFCTTLVNGGTEIQGQWVWTIRDKTVVDTRNCFIKPY